MKKLVAENERDIQLKADWLNEVQEKAELHRIGISDVSVTKAYRIVYWSCLLTKNNEKSVYKHFTCVQDFLMKRKPDLKRRKFFPIF